MANPYKYTQDNQSIVRIADSAMIPRDTRNSDYVRYLADGGASVTDPADPPPLIYTTGIVIDARTRTTNVTPTEVYRVTLAALTGYAALLTLIGVDEGNGNVLALHASVVAKRLSGGALMVGTPVVTANHADAGASAWAVIATVNGNDFIVSVTGAVGRSINWSLSGSVRSFTPAGV